MQHQRELDRDAAHHDEDLRREAHPPGRASASAALARPGAPTPSGIVMRKPARDGNGVARDADRAVAAASGGSGAALPGALARTFEASLGVDLSGVRVHTGAASAAAAHAVGARAYTLGQDIHFASGQFDPASRSGRHLLAHEVAHTVQQRGGAPSRQHKLAVSGSSDAFEVEADRAADAMVGGRPFRVGSAPGGVARVKDLSEAADRGEAEMNEVVQDTSVAVMHVSNVEDKATANQLLAHIRSHDAAIKEGIATKQIEPSVQIANTQCEDLLADYVESAEAETSEIATFQGLYGQLMKDFGRLDAMLKQFDGMSLANLKDPETADQHGAAQAKEVFGPDDAKKETARVERIDPAIKTRLDGMAIKKAALTTTGNQVSAKANDVAEALQTLSNKQREFVASTNAITTPEAQQALQDKIARAKNDYSAAAGKVVKDALMGAWNGKSGGAGGAAKGAALGAGKSVWTNVITPKLNEALEAADIQVGAFPDNAAAADKLEAEKKAWVEVQARASAILTQRNTVRQKVDALGTQFTAYAQARELYENEMIQLGQDMDKAAKVGRGPKPKDPCTCDEPAKPAPLAKDKGPRYETVMQFLAEADRFVAQAEVVKTQGERELQVAADNPNASSQAHAKLRKATSSAAAPSFFYSVSKLEVKRPDGTSWTKLTPIRNNFTMHNGLHPGSTIDGSPDEAHRYGSAEGADGYGANQAIGVALQQLDGAKAKIAAYRASLASAVGVG